MIKSSIRAAVLVGLAATLLSACGIQAKPVAGTRDLTSQRGYHSISDDPRGAIAACLTGAGFHIREYSTKAQGVPAIQVGTLPTGPTILFEPSLEGNMYLVVSGQAIGAEAIGTTLLYPNKAGDAALTTVEGCDSIGAPQPVLADSPH